VEVKDNMEYKVEKVKAPGRDAVEMLKETYEKGKPEGEEMGRWRQKFDSREERIKYLQNGERYFFSKEGYGSEKRKNPA
jgi:hypothetical protein